MNQPVSTSTPQSLAQVRQWLAITFLIALPLNIVVALVTYTELLLQLRSVLSVLEIGQLVVSVLLLVVLYIAARRLGFGKFRVIIVLLLSFLVGPLALVLVVSAYVRLTKLLRAAG